MKLKFILLILRLKKGKILSYLKKNHNFIKLVSFSYLLMLVFQKY